MKTKTELEHSIISVTTKINQKFPELTKYINEMPVNISENNQEEINTKNLIDYHNSLVELLEKYSKTHTSMGYEYPDADDIYNRGKIESEVNPNDLSKIKTANEEEGSLNEKDFNDDMSSDDLDIPGSELDDQQECVGSEDEENNYYSLGGDNHTNLDEDKS
jgi:hypothetical protein